MLDFCTFTGMSFSVYRSSAGSGKTHTLVQEYLKIVLGRESTFRNVLAITFTNKAANEMRERILRSLHEISRPEDHSEESSVKHMLPGISRETGLSKDQLSSNADQVLTSILHNYQDFSVGTIDSFIHRIIRTFAFDLHLPLNFEVELDEQNMVGMAVDLLLGKVGLEDETTKILKQYTSSRIMDEKNWDIERDLKQFSRRLLKDDIAEFLPALKALKSETLLEVNKKLNQFIRTFEAEITLRAAALMEFWKVQKIEEGDLYQKGRGVFAWVGRLASADYSKLKVTDTVAKSRQEDKWYSADIDQSKKGSLEAEKAKMLELFDAIISYLGTNKAKYLLFRLLKKNIFPLAVLNEIEGVIGQIRTADGVIHISEFDKRIARVVNNEPVPFIYERLGERYQHFLIDEFQDTSILEWQNILPLVENALATDNFCMVVGDAKQAIYRFKGGEVEQLTHLPKIYKKPPGAEMNAREEQLVRAHQDKVLNHNYRSYEEIINFNNDFYTFLSTQMPSFIQDIYKDAWQEAGKPRPGGEVRFKFIDSTGKKADWESEYFGYILKIVAELKSKKGYSYSNMAVLCRSNNDASSVAGFLLENGIDVISAESLLLSSSAEVKFLVFCLDYITNNSDMLALAGIITYLLHGNEEGELHLLLTICREEDQNDKALRAWNLFNDYLQRKRISFNPSALKQMGLYERVEALYRIFLANETADPYILFFMDAVFEYSRNKRMLPEDFTTYWRENSKNYSIVVPEGMDAVNVMTIHKAKGLEFPVVIYPFANSTLDIARDQKWLELNEPDLQGLKIALLPMSGDLEETNYAEEYEKEKEKALLDLLNVLYVATTRPTERLFILCKSAGAKSKNTELKSIPAFLKSWLQHKGLWVDEQDEYIIGQQAPLPAIASRIEPAIEPKCLISSDWRRKVILSGNAADYWDLEDNAINLQWGQTVHAILARIEKANDLDKVIAEELNQGRITDNEAEALSNQLAGIIQDSEVAPFFDGRFKVKNEVAVMRTGGREYRPDRLMFADDKVIVMDYKTGAESKSHEEQVNNYGLLLKEMGYDTVEKYLLYIGPGFKLHKI